MSREDNKYQIKNEKINECSILLTNQLVVKNCKTYSHLRNSAMSFRRLCIL